MSKPFNRLTPWLLLNVPLIAYVIYAQVAAAQGRRIVFVSGPARIVMTPTFDWVCTHIWLLLMYVLAVSLLRRRGTARTAFAWGMSLLSICYLFSVLRYGREDYTDYAFLRGGGLPSGTLVMNAQSDWQTNSLLRRFRLDYSFSGALLLALQGCLLPFFLWRAGLPSVRRDPNLCATCGYCLRGLPAPGRCPECGSEFNDEPSAP